MNGLPATLIQAVQYFSDPKVCFEAMLPVKWPKGDITCPKCGGTAVGVVRSRSMLQCKAKDCRKQFSVKVGTIFEESKLPLHYWFVAIWAIANCKNGISSYELSRALGVTQKTAWFMNHRIRLAMKTPAFRKLRGEVEGDETFIGGKSRNMHQHKRVKKIAGRGPVGKAIVQGLLERTVDDNVSQVRTFIVPSRDDVSLIPNVVRNVEADSYLYTDAAPGYVALAGRYMHAAVDHIAKYVSGRVHTNGLENFWALFKRCIKGTYVAVAPFHLERYADEESWRFNFRDLTDGRRFQRVLAAVVGKRITYRVLTAQNDAGFMGIR